jgi:hypothetical protein
MIAAALHKAVDGTGRDARSQRRCIPRLMQVLSLWGGPLPSDRERLLLAAASAESAIVISAQEWLRFARHELATMDLLDCGKVAGAVLGALSEPNDATNATLVNGIAVILGPAGVA